MLASLNTHKGRSLFNTLFVDFNLSDPTALIFFIFIGILMGVFAVVIGGAAFVNIPVFQLLFPELSFGGIIGNLKMGSFFRAVSTTLSTHRHINHIDNVKVGIIGFIGMIIGASLISELSQFWVFPATILAIIFALYAPKLTRFITPMTFHIVSFFMGIYAGIFGAGLGVILVALLRVKHPEDTDIAHVKIQARFLEFLLVLSAVVTLILHGNMVAQIWFLGR